MAGERRRERAMPEPMAPRPMMPTFMVGEELSGGGRREERHEYL